MVPTNAEATARPEGAVLRKAPWLVSAASGDEEGKPLKLENKALAVGALLGIANTAEGEAVVGMVDDEAGIETGIEGGMEVGALTVGAAEANSPNSASATDGSTGGGADGPAAANMEPH